MTIQIRTETKDIQLSLPMPLWEELQLLIPQRQHAQFWVELLNRELRRIRFEQAWHGAAGAWSNENHPDLTTAADIETYIRHIRETNPPQSWDEIIAEDIND